MTTRSARRLLRHDRRRREPARVPRQPSSRPGLGLPHVASGDLFRAAMRDGTTLGKEVRRYIELARSSRTTSPCGSSPPVWDSPTPPRAPSSTASRAPARRPRRSIGAGQARPPVAGALYIEVDTRGAVKRAVRALGLHRPRHTYHAERPPPGRRRVRHRRLGALSARRRQAGDHRARLERQLPPMYEVVDHYTERGVLTPSTATDPSRRSPTRSCARSPTGPRQRA